MERRSYLAARRAYEDGALGKGTRDGNNVFVRNHHQEQDVSFDRSIRSSTMDDVKKMEAGINIWLYIPSEHNAVDRTSKTRSLEVGDLWLAHACMPPIALLTRRFAPQRLSDKLARKVSPPALRSAVDIHSSAAAWRWEFRIGRRKK